MQHDKYAGYTTLCNRQDATATICNTTLWGPRDKMQQDTMQHERASINTIKENFSVQLNFKDAFSILEKLFGDMHLRASDFKLAIKTIQDFAVIMKQFRALAFVPAIDVIALLWRTYQFTIWWKVYLDDLSDFPHYFEKNMDRFIRRLRALFPMELWNVRDRVERALPLTNNSVGGLA